MADGAAEAGAERRGTAGGHDPAPLCRPGPAARVGAAVLAVAVLAVAVLAGGCGRFGRARDEDSGVYQEIGSGVDFAGHPAVTVVDPVTGDSGSAPSAPPEVVPVEPGDPGPTGPHPTTPDGRTILNSTVAMVEGFRLTLTVAGELAYSTRDELLLRLVVENQRPTEEVFDPDALGAAQLRTPAGEVVWSNGDCFPDLGDGSFDPGPGRLGPGQQVILDHEYAGYPEYDRSGRCALGPGEYDVVLAFVWCPADRVDHDRSGNPYCDQGRAQRLEAPPLRITLH